MLRELRGWHKCCSFADMCCCVLLVMSQTRKEQLKKEVARSERPENDPIIRHQEKFMVTIT